MPSEELSTWFYHVGIAHEINKDDDNSWFSSPRKTERPSISQQVPTKRSHDDIDGDNESNSVKNKAMKLSGQEKKRLREQGKKAKIAKNMDNEISDARLPILQTKDTNDTITNIDEVTAKASVIDSAEDERDKAPKKPGAEAEIGLKSVSQA